MATGSELKQCQRRKKPLHLSPTKNQSIKTFHCYTLTQPPLAQSFHTASSKITSGSHYPRIFSFSQPILQPSCDFGRKKKGAEWKEGGCSGTEDYDDDGYKYRYIHTRVCIYIYIYIRKQRGRCCGTAQDAKSAHTAAWVSAGLGATEPLRGSTIRCRAAAARGRSGAQSAETRERVGYDIPRGLRI